MLGRFGDAVNALTVVSRKTKSYGRGGVKRFFF